ncbi:MAG: copper-binding protein [Pseudomonadota bacterium]
MNLKIRYTLALSLALSPFSTAWAADGMDMSKPANAASPGINAATGVVQKVDVAGGKVTIAHGPIKSLSWSAMTMAFVVKDKALFKKLEAGKTVSFQIVQEGADYVVTAVK